MNRADGTPLRVAQVIDALDVGGAERVVTRLAEAAGGSPDVELTVVTLRESRTDTLLRQVERAGVELVCVPARTRHHLADVTMIPRLRRVLRHHDVVQGHLGTANILGLLAARTLRLPAIATLHSIALGEDEERPGKLRDVASDLALRWAPTTVVAVGEAVRDAQAHRIPGGRVEVITNPAPPADAITPEERQAARASLGLDGPVTVAVGRLEPEKGLDVAVRALAAVTHPVTLVLAGDGSRRAELAELAAALDLGDRIRFLGQVEDVRPVLAAADVFVSSSRREGMPMAILEAMSAGLPVVATDVGDVARTVGDAGSVVAPEDPDALGRAIEEVLGDERRRAAMAHESRRLATEVHGSDAWFRRWSELWHSLATDGRRTSGSSRPGTGERYTTTGRSAATASSARSTDPGRSRRP